MDREAPITEKLELWGAGDEAALAELMELVYGELQKLARGALANERTGALQTTALINEAYLRFARLRGSSWANRKAFFAFASRLMRRILVDEARRRRAQRRGGGRRDLELDTSHALPQDEPIDILIVDEMLERLGAHDERAARIVELKFFAGLAEREIAEVMGISRATVSREWSVARRFLALEYRSEEET